MRLIDRATCDSHQKRFVERITEYLTVWYLSHSDGVANSTSNTDEERTILMFWSDKAYASRVLDAEYPEYEIESMDLFDFLYRWLPGMTGDDVLAGVNWTHDLIGVEVEPFDLREEIEDKMPASLLEEHEKRYEELTS